MTSIPLASSSVKAKPAAPSASEYTFSQKWGDDPFTGMGHTQLPNALVEYGARIGLTMTECWLVTCVLRFKYTPADPYPSQARLGAIVGKREETVRHVLKAVERKGLMRVTKVRGDLGQFTHSVYDFAPLRAALNEAYHCDHPAERPILAPPSATGHNQTVGQPPVKNPPSHRSKNAETTGQKRPQPPCQNPPLRRLSEEEREEEKKEDRSLESQALTPARTLPTWMREPKPREPEWSAVAQPDKNRYRRRAAEELSAILKADGLRIPEVAVESRARNLWLTELAAGAASVAG